MSEPRQSRRWAWELGGAVFALLLGALAVAQLSTTARAWLLYLDGDSVLPALFRRGLDAGYGLDWAMSSVLFIPELGVSVLLSLIMPGPAWTAAALGVVTVLGLYLAGRLAGGAVVGARGGHRHAHPVALAATGTALVVLLACLDHTDRRGSFELASLLLTGTYYSATVIALVLGVALTARILGPERVDGGAPSAPATATAAPTSPRGAQPPTPGRRRLALWLGIVVAVSTLSNPLIIPWFAVPLVIVLLLALFLRLAPLFRLAVVAATTAVGVMLGMLARIPLEPLITLDGSSYAQPSDAAESARYYGDRLAEWVADARGATSAGIVLVCLLASIAATLLAARRRDAPALVLAAFGWASPLVVVVGGIVLGTHATRYLEPLVFAPVLGVVALLALVSRGGVRSGFGSRSTSGGATGSSGPDGPLGSPSSRGLRIPMLVGGAVMLGIGAAVLAPAAPRDTAREADVACVAEWVDGQDGVGAGSYWDARPVKSRLDDTRKLVQIDVLLGRYSWLVARAEASVASVSFIVRGPTAPVHHLDDAEFGAPVETVRCGGYTITDYGDAVVGLGDVHG